MKTKINIKNDIKYCLVKGEIRTRTENPWIRPFLQYIDKNPNANECDISSDLFGDNGFARKNAVKGILHYFKGTGLVEQGPNGIFLTEEGKKSFDTSKIWQGKKGVFRITLWEISPEDVIILDIKDVPENYYDNGKNDCENFPEEYGENLDNVFRSVEELQIEKIDKRYRPINECFEYFSVYDTQTKEVKISAKHGKDEKKNFETVFVLPENLVEYLKGSGDEDD